MNQTCKKGKGINHTQWLVHGECWIILNRTKSYSLAVRNEDKNLTNVVWMLRIYQVDYLWVQSQANVCLWGVWKLGTFINFFSILFYRYYLKSSEKMSWKSHWISSLDFCMNHAWGLPEFVPARHGLYRWWHVDTGSSGGCTTHSGSRASSPTSIAYTICMQPLLRRS